MRYMFWKTSLFVLIAAAAVAADQINLPGFPLPEFARDKHGNPMEMGFMGLYRELQKGGVRDWQQIEAVDSDYTVIASSSMGLLSAWLETTCQSVGLDLPQARTGAYDGSVYARLLTVATGIAATRQSTAPLAMPLGVMICIRRHSWGVLPGDGQRDAYVIVATERGFLVYDPPTRQMAPLAEFPNNSEVLRIRL
jgi:hypothetical protein